jgi:hypothetical protein
MAYKIIKGHLYKSNKVSALNKLMYSLRYKLKNILGVEVSKKRDKTKLYPFEAVVKSK